MTLSNSVKNAFFKMKLFSTIMLLAATADARRRKKNKTAEEGSGEGSGVAPVTGEDAATVVGDLVDGIVAAGKASGQRSNALDKRVNFLRARKSKNKLYRSLNYFSWCLYNSRRRMHNSLQR